MKTPIIITSIVLLCSLTGCAQLSGVSTTAPVVDEENTPVLVPTAPAETEDAAEESGADTTPEVVAETPTNATDEAATATSEQHPAEQLINSFTVPVQANGEVLVLYGQVLDVNGTPLPNTTVEIWQTDAGGVYDHPGDSGTATRDTSFQFYGSTITSAEGWYAFRTLVPGRYEPRPRHIHFKVKEAGNTLLTSQFYFSDDIAEVAGEGMFRAVGDSGDLLLLQLVQGNDMLLANGQIVLAANGGTGTLPATPSQGEGPYYPLVNLADYDNDLLMVE